MLQPGKALKVSIYLSEGSTRHGTACASSILDFLFFRGVSGATVLKGVAGFGVDHHLHTSSLVELSDHLPVKVEFIETREKVEEILGKLTELAGTGMIEVQETTVAKAPSRSVALPVAPATSNRFEGKARLLRIYIGEKDRWNDRPLHEALVEAMRANEIAGVTVYRGMMGYGPGAEEHHRKGLSHDAPLMLSVVDREDRVNSFMPLLEKMVANGMAVLSDVDVVQYRYGPGQQENVEEAG